MFTENKQLLFSGIMHISNSVKCQLVQTLGRGVCPHNGMKIPGLKIAKVNILTSTLNIKVWKNALQNTLPSKNIIYRK
jgi:hypothetical protein